MSVLGFDQIRKSYGRRIILDDVSLNLEAGRLILLVGPNGVGKSTLLKIIAGLIRPDKGWVRCDGSLMPWQRALRRYRRKVIYLHQDPYLFRGTVRQNLAYGLRLKHLHRDEREQRVEEALTWTELKDLAEERAHRLSGGQRQRVALARAWVMRPKVLLLDEPTASLDPTAKGRVREMLTDLKASGISLVVTSHEPQHFAGIENLCLRLQDGRLSEESPQAGASVHPLYALQGGISAEPHLSFDH
ncbi:MAG: heme ABC exporter ATP-binding protein CcmA [Gammaproteobacteria bacterium]